METLAHRRLKEFAIAFLRERSCLAVATEVRCPISRYRVDVAGYRDSMRTNDSGRSRRKSCEPCTIVIECKQSRSDFLRDNERKDELLAHRDDLHSIRRSIEENRVKKEEPNLRKSGSALFAELEEWDFSKSKLPSYRKVLAQLRLLDKKIYGHTKFHLLKQYQLADYLFIASPRGMIRRCEVPPGWGLLECPRNWLTDDCSAGAWEKDYVDIALSETIAAVKLSSRADHRVKLLRNIAVSASFAAMRVKPSYREQASEPALELWM